jgi:cis-L-3-hydroxyproline dehydratase
MDIELTSEEREMLDGEHGEATRLAMRILTRVSPMYGAKSLLSVTMAHIDGCIYEGVAGLEFAERLAGSGGAVRVPTSLNVISLDRHRWQSHGLNPAYADHARRLGEAYLAMGATPSFTCAPYQTSNAPIFGEQIAWSESNAVAFANSIIGARTNRYGDYLDISCALTGRAPAAGLHLDEHRLGTHHLRLRNVPIALQERDDFYPVLGYLIGDLVTNGVPVVSGLDHRPTDDQLKAMAAAIATSGAVALFHLVGVTPEAATIATAFGGQKPAVTIEVDAGMLRQSRRMLTTATDSNVDVVAFGSPHCSLEECRTIAHLVEGYQAQANVTVYITTSQAVRSIMARNGLLERLERFGATVTADTCIVVSPLISRKSGVLMTNSAKYAHYGPGIIGMQSVFGTTSDCVRSAIEGRITLEEGPWAA